MTHPQICHLEVSITWPVARFEHLTICTWTESRSLQSAKWVKVRVSSVSCDNKRVLCDSCCFYSTRLLLLRAATSSWRLCYSFFSLEILRHKNMKRRSKRRDCAWRRRTYRQKPEEVKLFELASRWWVRETTFKRRCGHDQRAFCATERCVAPSPDRVQLLCQQEAARGGISLVFKKCAS